MDELKPCYTRAHEKFVVNTRAAVPLFIAAWSIVSTAAMIWGTTYNWPDFVHVNYGFPLVWGTHTLNTIAGPVDKWGVDLNSFLIDLATWLGSMTAVAAIITFARR